MSAFHFYIFFLGLQISIGSRNLSIVLQACHVMSFYCLISIQAQCGIVLFSDCTSCTDFSAGFRNPDNQNGRPQFVRDFSLQSPRCVDFCIAPPSR